MYQVSFEHVGQLLSYEVRLKFWDADADDNADNDDAKAITITRLFL